MSRMIASQRCILLFLLFTILVFFPIEAFEATRMQEQRRRQHGLCQRSKQPTSQRIPCRPSTVLLYTQEGYNDQENQERQKLIRLVHFLREMGITLDEYESMVELLEDRQEELLQRACAMEELLETLNEVETGSANMERDHASYFAAKFQAVWEEEELDGEENDEEEEIDDEILDNLDVATVRNYVSVYPTDVTQLYGQTFASSTATQYVKPAKPMIRAGPPRPSQSFMYRLQNAGPSQQQQKTPTKLRKMVNSFVHRMKQPGPRPPRNPPNIVNFLLQERNKADQDS